MRCAWALVVFCALLAGASAANPEERVDLALVLAADVSRSVDQEEFQLQREGYAKAFTHPQVLNAIRAGANRAIAVTFIEWSGVGDQKVVADWAVIRDEESGAVFASRILAPPRAFATFTAIGDAIDFAIKRFDEANEAKGITAERRVIDISGDGTSNSGRLVSDARDDAVVKGITINGLTILNLHPNPGYFAHTQPPEGLPNYYRRNVIGGPTAFVVEIEDFKSFGQAIVSKLVGEIAQTRAPRTKDVAAR